MEQIKLHQWLYGLALVILLGSCSKKNYPDSPPTDRRVVYDNSDWRNRRDRDAYRPPVVIVISDRLARYNRRGEMYYDDQKGYRYWRYNDGRYYLDERYGLYRDERRNWGRKYRRGH